MRWAGHLLVIALQGVVLTNGQGRNPEEKELLAKYLLQRILDREAAEAGSSVVYPEYDDSVEEEEIFQSEDSQVVPTFVPAPLLQKKANSAGAGGATKGDSRFSMPLAHLGNKKYYLGMFFKANWFRSAQYCRFHGMHLASLDSAEEQRELEEHIKSLGLGDQHFWTSGSDLGEEGKFIWMATGKPIKYTHWNAGEPNNFEYDNGEKEHCLEMWDRDGAGLAWNDTPCSFETFFICQA